MSNHNIPVSVRLSIYMTTALQERLLRQLQNNDFNIGITLPPPPLDIS